MLLTGSSATLIQEGLDESLAGRFELIESTHWTYPECAEAFGYSLDEYLFFGGYPWTAPLHHDRRRWLRYMNTSEYRCQNTGARYPYSLSVERGFKLCLSRPGPAHPQPPPRRTRGRPCG